MSDRPGLSIFDKSQDQAERAETGNTGADDATQVMPAVKAPQAESSKPPQQRQSRPAPTGATSAQKADAPRPAPVGPAAVAKVPGFPVVRRGYDPAAVDRQLHALAGEKAGVLASLSEARARIGELEQQLAEHDNPT